MAEGVLELERPEPGRATTVLTSWTGTLLQALDAMGIDGQALAQRAGISPDDLEDPERRIALEATSRLWRLAVEATGDPGLGLEVSRFVRPGTFHTLGHAVITSSTLREALERIAQFSRVTADCSVVRVEEGPEEIALVISFDAAGPLPTHESIDAIMATIVRAVRFMLAQSVSPRRLALVRPEPERAERFGELFRCPIEFGAPRNRLSFDRATAEQAVPGGNPRLARLHDSVTAAYLEGLDPATTVRQVRSAIGDLLPTGEPTVASVASVLSTSARTLQRQLQEEGTSFREILREVRLGLAVAYLRRGDQTVTEITRRLGFSETPSFSRAFKQWTGVSPTHYR